MGEVMLRPQTIQIFLPAGDPRGVRVAEITTRIVRTITRFMQAIVYSRVLPFPKVFPLGFRPQTGLHLLVWRQF